MDEKCGCDEDCHYTPGRYIEFNRDLTITQLMDIIYGDLSFLYCVFFQIIELSATTDPRFRICDNVVI